MAVLVALFSLNANAFSGDAVVNGIVYHIVTKAKTATVIEDGVVYNMAFLYYGGVVRIPKTIEYEGVVCDVTAIGNKAFRKSVDVTSIIIPNSVTSIGSEAFSGCSGLTSITIPNSVTSIGYKAFADCGNLTSITIGSSVTEIGNEAFSGCHNLTAVHIEDLAAWCNIPFYETMNGNSLLHSNPLEYAHHLYQNGEEVKDLVIPNNVTTIGRNAFCGCSGLKSVTIPNSVKSIGSDAFSGCTGLTSIDIPNSVTSIGNSTFEDCTGLTSIDIPNSVPSIGNSTFSGCTGLTSIDIPNSVTYIGNSAFSGCSGLTSIDIPNSVLAIDDDAFENCAKLSSVNIGNSVKYIGEGAFSYCQDLENVYCYAEELPHASSSVTDILNLQVFNNSEIEYATLHVPENLIETYKEGSYKLDYWAPGHHHEGCHQTDWGRFGKIVALTEEETSVKDVNIMTQCDYFIDYYGFDGQKSSTPQKGINILRYSDGTTKKVLFK